MKKYTFAPSKPGSITVSKDAVKAYFASKDLDAVEIATAYVKAWADKVTPGTKMIVAKMKCALADGPCGCAEDSTLWKCTGPYPEVPIEIIKEVLLAGVEGVKTTWELAPEAIVVDHHVHIVEFVGPGEALYVEKI